MRQILLFILVLLIISACSKVRFVEPQPTNAQELDEIPSMFHGTYLDVNGDSLTVATDYFKISSDDKKFLSSDRVVLKKKGAYYFLSCKEVLISGNESEEEGWELLPFQMKADSLIIFFINTTDDSLTSDAVSSISSILPLETRVSGRDEYYLVDPSVRQFGQLMESGIFSIANKYGKVDTSINQ